MARTYHRRWYEAEGPASGEEWWHHSEMAKSNISFQDESFIFPVLVFSVKKKKITFSSESNSTEKNNNPMTFNQKAALKSRITVLMQNFLASHTKMPRRRQCYFSQFTHEQWSTGLRELLGWFKAASVHCSLLDFEDAIPNHTNSWFAPHDFFPVDVGIQHRSEIEYRSFRLSAASRANGICFQSTHVPFSPHIGKAFRCH